MTSEVSDARGGRPLGAANKKESLGRTAITLRHAGQKGEAIRRGSAIGRAPSGPSLAATTRVVLWRRGQVSFCGRTAAASLAARGHERSSDLEELVDEKALPLLAACRYACHYADKCYSVDKLVEDVKWIAVMCQFRLAYYRALAAVGHGDV